MPLMALGFGVAAEMGLTDTTESPLGLRVVSVYVFIYWIGALRRWRRALRVARSGTVYNGVHFRRPTTV
jgi:hypothetical protein